MNARRTHRWILWLLPLLLLRSFVPVGFMLSWSEHGLQVVLCSGSGPIPLPSAESGHAQHGDGTHDHSAAHDSSVCPFAVANVAGALPASAAAAARVISSAEYIAGLAARESPAHPFRIDRIRGPPIA